MDDIDLADFQILADLGRGGGDTAGFLERVDRADAFIVVTPHYDPRLSRGIEDRHRHRTGGMEGRAGSIRLVRWRRGRAPLCGAAATGLRRAARRHGVQCRELPLNRFALRRAALTEAVTLVHDGRVPEAVYRAAAEVFKEDELAAVIWAAIVINAYNRIAITTRMEPGPISRPRDRTSRPPPSVSRPRCFASSRPSTAFGTVVSTSFARGCRQRATAIAEVRRW